MRVKEFWCSEKLNPLQTRSTTFSGVSLLLADDEHYCHLLISKVLSKSGVNIIHAYNGVQAVELAKKFKPEIALVDIIMPVKNGIQVASEIKSLNPEIICIAYTADRSSIEWTDKEGGIFESVILKPALPADILNILEAAMVKTE